SRGGHFREDYPEKDPEAAKFNVAVRRAEDGSMALERVPVRELPEELKAVIQEMGGGLAGPPRAPESAVPSRTGRGGRPRDPRALRMLARPHPERGGWAATQGPGLFTLSRYGRGGEPRRAGE